jgi:3-deoxy-7-phosphoheptulonate synthase
MPISSDWRRKYAELFPAAGSGESGRPVLLKRGFAATVEEWLMAAEYILATGNYKVILCERGIKTFETATRSTLDISSIPLVKRLSHLPFWLTPATAAVTGAWFLPCPRLPWQRGPTASSWKCIVIPATALCDGPQSLTPANFLQLMKEISLLADAVGRKLPLPQQPPLAGRELLCQ